MDKYKAIIRFDYVVVRETIHDLKLRLDQLLKWRLISIEGRSKSVLIIRNGVFVGWMNISRDGDDYSLWLDQPLTDREHAFWQAFVDMLT